MIIDEYKEIRKLLAEEGKKITNPERSFFSDFVYLGKNDTPDNYEEVGREIWKHYVKEDNPDILELQAKANDLENETIALGDLLLDTDFRLLELELTLETIE